MNKETIDMNQEKTGKLDPRFIFIRVKTNVPGYQSFAFKPFMTVPSMKDEKFIKENDNNVYFYALKKLDKELIIKVPDSASVFFEKSLFKCLLNFHGNQKEKSLDYATEYGYVDANIQTLLDTLFPQDGTGKFYIQTKNDILVPYTVISTMWTKGDWMLDGKGSNKLPNNIKYGSSYTEYNPNDIPSVDETLNPESENPMVNKEFVKEPEPEIPIAIPVKEEIPEAIPVAEPVTEPVPTLVAEPVETQKEPSAQAPPVTTTQEDGLLKSYKYFGFDGPVDIKMVLDTYTKMADQLDLMGLIQEIKKRTEQLKTINNNYFLVEDVIDKQTAPVFDNTTINALSYFSLDTNSTPQLTKDEFVKLFDSLAVKFYNDPVLMNKIVQTVNKLKDMNSHYDNILKNTAPAPQNTNNLTGGQNSEESQQVKLAREHLEDVTNRQNGPLAYYITVYLDLEKGSALSPEQMKELKCRKVWSSVQKSYAELMGQSYEPDVNEENNPDVEQSKEVSPTPPPLKQDDVGGKKRNKKYKHLFRL